MSFGTKAANEMRGEARAPVDTGPRERAQHGGGIRIAPRKLEDAGGINVSVGAQARYECVLDALLGEGMLDGTQGSKEDRRGIGRSRYEAGMKLRRLFVGAGLVGVRAFDPEATRGKLLDIPDEVALARRGYNDLMRRLGAYGTIASGPCCFDVTPDNDRFLSNVRRALDELCLVML